MQATSCRNLEKNIVRPKGRLQLGEPVQLELVAPPRPSGAMRIAWLLGQLSQIAWSVAVLPLTSVLAAPVVGLKLVE